MRHMIEYGDYMPHGMCLLWQPWLVVLWAGSDLLIFLSYMAIPIALLTVLKRRDDVPHPGLVMLFASFILLCGLTHLAGIVTLWWPIYPWIGALKLATGIVSAITAITLFRLVPTLVAFPSPAQLGEANNRLESEIVAHKETLASLERKVEQRTEELRHLNKGLAVQAREAVHRSGNLLAVVSSLASQSSKGTHTKEEFVETLLGRIRALAKATATIKHAPSETWEDLDVLAREQLEPLVEAYPDQVAITGEKIAIGSEAAQQIALALHELATNAQKYSLPIDDEAAIEVSWRRVPQEGGPDRFELQWSEKTARTAAAFTRDNHEGFGTKLLTRIVPTMLRGTARREFEDGFLRYCLDVPLSAVEFDANRSFEETKAADLVDQSFDLEG
jgi:two-component sensor histidine kinase